MDSVNISGKILLREQCYNSKQGEKPVIIVLKRLNSVVTFKQLFKLFFKRGKKNNFLLF